MFCRYCGHEQSDGAFCDKCGKPLGATAAQTTESNVQGNNAPASKAKKSKAPIIAIAAVCVVALGAGAVVLLSKGKSNDTIKTDDSKASSKAAVTTKADVSEETVQEDSIDSYEDEVVVEELPEDDALPEITLNDKTLKYLSYYEIAGDAADLYRSNYGGELSFYRVSTLEVTKQIRKNSEAVWGDLLYGYDMFITDATNFHPLIATSYEADDGAQPIENIVDTSANYWEPTEKVREMFKTDGHEYLAVTDVTPAYFMLYNKNDFDSTNDPATLYKNGEWTWDKFRELCVSTDKKTAVDGWVGFEALAESSGTAMFGYKDGKISSGIDDENYLSVIKKIDEIQAEAPGSIKSKWHDKYDMNNSLFTIVYPSMIETGDSTYLKSSDLSDVMIVPFPKLDEASEHYMPASVTAYQLSVTAGNTDAFNAFVNCAAKVSFGNEYKESKRQMWADNYGWSDEMIEMYEECCELAYKNPVVTTYDGYDLTTEQGYAGAVFNAIVSVGYSGETEVNGKTYTTLSELVEDGKSDFDSYVANLK